MRSLFCNVWSDLTKGLITIFWDAASTAAIYQKSEEDNRLKFITVHTQF
jgi:hypothetical protein